MEKILFLDFDGVLFNTVDEAYQICINTSMYKNKELPLNSLELFRRYRPLIGPAWNYYFVLNSIINNIELDETFLFEYTKEAEEFEKDFFNTRNILKKTTYSKWLKYNKKYSFLDRFIEMKKCKNLKIYIVTTKDEQTVIDLLNEFKIDIVKNNYILGRSYFERFLSKKEVLLSVLKNIEYHALFIDDIYEHLKPCEQIKNLELIQPDWGYANRNDNIKYISNEDEVLSKIKSFLEV